MESLGSQHWIEVRSKSRFLHRLDDGIGRRRTDVARGRPANCRLPAEVVLSRNEVGVLKRSTLGHEIDFVVLKLEPETIAGIFKQVLTAGLKQRILHVQIERDGVLQLGAYDNFHKDCVVTGTALSTDMLAHMQSAGLIRSYRPAVNKPDAAR